MAHKWEIKSKDFDARGHHTDERTVTVVGNYADVVDYLRGLGGILVSLREIQGYKRGKYEHCLFNLYGDESTDHVIFKIY